MDLIKHNKLKTFVLERTEDETGISGVGIVAEGVVFSTGLVVLAWLTETSSIAHYPNIESVEKLHGHNGKTKIVFESDIQPQDIHAGCLCNAHAYCDPTKCDDPKAGKHMHGEVEPWEEGFTERFPGLCFKQFGDRNHASFGPYVFTNAAPSEIMDFIRSLLQKKDEEIARARVEELEELLNITRQGIALPLHAGSSTWYEMKRIIDARIASLKEKE